MRSAKFGVVVCKASMLNLLGGGVNLPWVYMHCTIYMKLMWCNGFPEIYAQLEEGVWSVCYGYMCIVLYI